MPTYMFQYEMLPTTWFYVSSLIVLAAFFKFNRFFSIRNLDIACLLMATPGLLLMAMGETLYGYIWLFVFGIILIVRLFFDTVMVRRPLLEPNLSQGGMILACVALLGFTIANVLVNRGERCDDIRTLRLEQIQYLKEQTEPSHGGRIAKKVPGYPPFLAFVEQSNEAVAPKTSLIPSMQAHWEKMKNPPKEGLDDSSLPDSPEITPEPNPGTAGAGNATEAGESAVSAEMNAANALPVELSLDSLPSKERPLSGFAVFLSLAAIIASHTLIVLGIIYVCHCHFDNIRTGVAAATFYLLLPYTTQMLGRLDHFIPAALMVWAIAMYRRPIIAGVLLGFAGGLVFYPLFLLPLWVGFYWKRGWIRFLSSAAITLAVMVALLALSPTEHFGSYSRQLMSMFGWSRIMNESPNGFWSHYLSVYRYPLFAGYLVICAGMTIWPSRKHLATLLSCSAIVMLAVQFWMPHEGGLYMAWYLPIVILTVFRPNLEDRIAQTTVLSFR